MIAGFHALSKRQVAMSLIYSAEDIGLEQFREHFGQKPDCLKAFPGARLTIIEDADHNLTPAHAREIYVGEIRNMALQAKRQAPATETGCEYSKAAICKVMIANRSFQRMFSIITICSSDRRDGECHARNNFAFS